MEFLLIVKAKNSVFVSTLDYSEDFEVATHQTKHSTGGERKMSNLEAKNFFKLIPFTAVECSIELMPATATLRTSKGRCWHVEVNKCDGRMYFEKGWRRFIYENSTMDRDILIFSYVGFSVFDVKVLGLDGCEKIVSQEHEKENLLVEVGERWEIEEDDDDDDDDEEEEEEDGDDDDEEEEERTMNDEGISAMEVEDEELNPEKYVQHLNPCFVASLRLQRKNELYVPSNVIKDYDLSLEDKEEVAFLDPYNRKSIGKVVKWKDGRTCIAGWRRFCNRNKVDLQRDKCICEFLLEKEQEDETGQKTKIIQVHIIHGRQHTKSRKPSRKQTKRKHN